MDDIVTTPAELNEAEMDRLVGLIESMEDDLRAIKQIISYSHSSYQGVGEGGNGYFLTASRKSETDEGIEGIFDGERMVDTAGKTYQVSSNYASKSKLVEGDPLKLYITSDGKYYYKQIGPVERKTMPGVLKAEGNHYVVEVEDGQTYNVLTASVTYYMSLYHLQSGDKVMVMVPSHKTARWAVIDNVL